MIRVTPRLSRVISATAFASGLAVTLSAAAIAGGAAYLKIGDIKGEVSDSKHKGEIEIESWSWGASQAGKMGSHAGGGGGGAGKVSFGGDAPAAGAAKVDALTVKQGAAEAKKKGNVEYSWKVEEGVKGSQAPGEAEITLKSPPEAARPSADITLKRGVSEAAGGVRVATGDIDGDGRPRPAPGSGSIRITTKSPWGDCRVGASYPVLELSDSDARYRLIDAVITACGASSDVIPTDQISLNFAKIE